MWGRMGIPQRIGNPLGVGSGITYGPIANRPRVTNHCPTITICHVEQNYKMAAARGMSKVQTQARMPVPHLHAVTLAEVSAKSRACRLMLPLANVSSLDLE